MGKNLTESPMCNSKNRPLDKYIYIYGIAIVVIFGIIGNTLTYIILTKQKTTKGKTSLTIYLMKVLSLTDSSFLVIAAWSWIMPTIAIDYRKTSLWKFYLLKVVFQPVGSIAVMITNYTLVALSVHRFLVICYPMKKGLWQSKMNINFVLLGIAIFSVVFNFSRFFEEEIDYSRKIFITCFNKSVYLTKPTGIQNKYYNWIYMFFLRATFRLIIPFLLILYSNYKLLKTAKSLGKVAHQSTIEQNGPIADYKRKREYSLTVMMTALCASFLLFQIPNAAASVLQIPSFLLPNRNYSRIYAFLGPIGNFLLTVNSAVNFIIYYASHSQFRYSAKETLCKRITRRKRRAKQSVIIYTLVDSLHD